MNDDPIISVKVGDRVSWFGDVEFFGVIKGFALHKKEFLAYVVWENGKDDWYKGDCLVLVEEKQ